MAEPKVSAGDKVRKPSASFKNDLIDLVAKQRAGAEKNRPQPQIKHLHDRVKVKNISGSNLRRGDVLEFATFFLEDATNKHLWFEGDTPDLTRTGWGISLRPTPDEDVQEFLCVGVCLANVQFPDDDHEQIYANLESGQRMLHSADEGPAKILAVLDGTGDNEWEYLCVVQIMDDRRAVYIGKTDEDLDKGTTATVSRYDKDESDTGVNDEVRNLFCDVGTNKWVAYVDIGGSFFAIAGEMG